MTWRGSTTTQERILACLPYSLVLIYGAPLGQSLLSWAPRSAQIAYFALLGPILSLYSAIPLAGLVVFIALLLLVVRNERIRHFIRFNTMQAMLLSMALLLCNLCFGFLANIPGIAFLLTVLANALFLASLGAFGYAIVQSGRGHYAEIPTISDAAYMQVR